jgi:hypothetical protein
VASRLARPVVFLSRVCTTLLQNSLTPHVRVGVKPGHGSGARGASPILQIAVEVVAVPRLLPCAMARNRCRDTRCAEG